MVCVAFSLQILVFVFVACFVVRGKLCVFMTYRLQNALRGRIKICTYYLMEHVLHIAKKFLKNSYIFCFECSILHFR